MAVQSSSKLQVRVLGKEERTQSTGLVPGDQSSESWILERQSVWRLDISETGSLVPSASDMHDGYLPKQQSTEGGLGFCGGIFGKGPGSILTP